MKTHLVFVTALFFTLSSAAIAADKPTTKKSPAKKAVKKVPPSEPAPTPETTTPTPEAAAQPVEITPAPTQETMAPTNTTTEPPPPAAAETSSSADGYGKTEGLLGKFIFGPSVTLLGLPSPFRFGLETKWDNLLGLSFDYGFLPSLTISDAKLKYNSWRVVGRVFPWREGFYLGVGVGKQTFGATLSKTTAGRAVDFTIDVNNTIIVPQIGWRWTSQSGFFFGMELGVQLASATTTTFTSSDASLEGNPEFEANEADVKDKGNKYGSTTLPHVALVQLGWFL